jgi:thiol-disulfide isomerase/thioredoxin
MAATPSTMIELGTRLPTFSLPDTDSKIVSSGMLAKDKGALVIFMCNHCPFVKHIHEELSALGRDYPSKGIDIVAINSNDVANYPEDSPEKMKATKKAWNLAFHYLYDEDQSVAKAFQAACTPDFFLFDNQARLVYRGQLDESRPGNGKPVTGSDLRSAMDAVVAGKRVEGKQYPSLGCNIKWRK